MANTRILVLGYSVTAEKPGFVGIAKEEIESKYSAEVTKVGLGGLQPYHARYLFPHIIEENAPDILILDQATPAFRNFYKDQDDYRLSFMSLIRLCSERAIRLAILDFPRMDVDYTDDWVSQCHSGVCNTLGIPYKRVPLIDGILRDEVHTTEYGNRYYANFLKEMVHLARYVKVDPSYFLNVPRYGSIAFSKLLPEQETVSIDRGGYKADLVRIAENETLEIKLPIPIKVCGFTALMGPRTGTMELIIGGSTKRQLTYDQFCYYDRLGAFVFRGHCCGSRV